MAGAHVSEAEVRDMLDALRKDVVAFKLVENHIKKSRMNKIVERLSWHISREGVEEVKKIIDKYNEDDDTNDDTNDDYEAVPLTKEDWDTIVHPSGDCCLYMTFDERALREKESKAFNRISSFVSDEKKKNLKRSHAQTELTIRRGERFTGKSTLREVLERIKEGLVYGYYEGIVPSAQNHFLYSDHFDDIPIYKLQTGT